MTDQATATPEGAPSYGESLPGYFYSDAAVFAADIRLLQESQWLLIDHVSRIPRPGDYFLFSIGNESLIIVRDRESVVHAFYNVCRHRGSRICLQDEGYTAMLVCPYHSWSYSLDGQRRGGDGGRFR